MTEASRLDAADAIMASGNNITKWHLWDNRIGVEGAKAIAKALKHENNRVERLDLYENQIGDEGAKMIAEALKHENNKVQRLVLSWNRIGDEGAKAIAEALKHQNCIVNKVSVFAEFYTMWNVAIIVREWRKNLLLLLSAREVSRIGQNAPVRKLPSDLIRLLAGMVEIIPRDW